MYEELKKIVEGGYIVCNNCGRKEYPSSDVMLAYMNMGWPKCCGQTMTFVTKEEQRNEI